MHLVLVLPVFVIHVYFIDADNWKQVVRFSNGFWLTSHFWGDRLVAQILFAKLFCWLVRHKAQCLQSSFDCNSSSWCISCTIAWIIQPFLSLPLSSLPWSQKKATGVTSAPGFGCNKQTMRIRSCTEICLRHSSSCFSSMWLFKFLFNVTFRVSLQCDFSCARLPERLERKLNKEWFRNLLA